VAKPVENCCNEQQIPAIISVCEIMGYINPYPANVENKVISYNASKWQMGFNSAFKGLI
jgi:hypothetical protein